MRPTVSMLPALPAVLVVAAAEILAHQHSHHRQPNGHWVSIFIMMLALMAKFPPVLMMMSVIL